MKNAIKFHTPNEESRKIKLAEFMLNVENEFNVKLIYKRDSWFMKLIAFFMTILNKMNKNICSGEDFLSNFTMTFYGNLYLARKKEEYDLEFVSLLIHELQHTKQFRANPISFPFKYLLNSKDRMESELEAIVGEIIYYWKYGLIGTENEKTIFAYEFINQAADSLAGSYGLSPESKELIKSFLIDKLLNLKSGIDEKNEIVERIVLLLEKSDLI